VGGSTLNFLKGLRVCFIAGTLGQGGAERQLYYILQALKSAGAEVRLLSLTREEYWENPIRELGVTVARVGEKTSRWSRLARIVKEIRAFDPDVIQSQHFYTNIYCGVAGKALGIPNIGAVRNDGVSEIKANGRWLGKLCVTLPDCIAANSRNAIRNLTTLGYREGKLVLLPNVIDTNRFKARNKSATAAPFTILGLGRLERQKRFDRFLEIVTTLQAKIKSPVRAIIAGEGSLRSEIEAQAKPARQKGVEIELPGRVSDPLKLYQAADVLMLTSDWEGTPNVIMEAMARGLPVVATNVGGIADLIKDGETGLLFEPNDIPIAVTALERLAREPRLAPEIGRCARAFIEEHHSSILLPAILAELYKTILTRDK
jgi:glycosyltransferase involved in cell wall biosynthesis